VGRKAKAQKENPKESGDKRRQKILPPFYLSGMLRWNNKID
jgi:hypothetical protein